MGLTGPSGSEERVCRGKGTAAAKALSQEEGVMFETPERRPRWQDCKPERDCRRMSQIPGALRPHCADQKNKEESLGRQSKGMKVSRSVI